MQVLPTQSEEVRHVQGLRDESHLSDVLQFCTQTQILLRFLNTLCRSSYWFWLSLTHATGSRSELKNCAKRMYQGLRGSKSLTVLLHKCSTTQSLVGRLLLIMQKQKFNQLSLGELNGVYHKAFRY